MAARGAGTLVAGSETLALAVRRFPRKESSDGRDGTLEAVLAGRPSRPVTPLLRGGEIAALARARGGDLRGAREAVDRIAFSFAREANRVHRQGWVHRPVPQGPDGLPAREDRSGPTTGIPLFGTGAEEGAAARIRLSPEVERDLSNIATALAPNSPADNRVAIAISRPRRGESADGGSATPEGELARVLAAVGLETARARAESERSQAVLRRLEGIGERIAGVSPGRGGGQPGALPEGLPGLRQGDPGGREDVQHRPGAGFVRVTENSSRGVLRFNLERNKKRLEDLRVQGSTLREVARPSDDPVRHAEAAEIRSRLADHDQFLRNAGHARLGLQAAEQALAQLARLVTRAKEIAIAQSSDVHTPDTRAAAAQEVRQIRAEALALANRRVGDRFLFGGFRDSERPYGRDGAYRGDGGRIRIEVARDLLRADQPRRRGGLRDRREPLLPGSTGWSPGCSGGARRGCAGCSRAWTRRFRGWSG